MHTLNDAIEIIGKPRQTGDGYLVMDCAVARSGIQEYLAREMGEAFADRDPNEIIRVYRPDAVIFGKDSLASYTHKPLTNDHPSEAVSAATWKRDAIGWTGEMAYEDSEKKLVRVPMLMADASAIEDVKSGKSEWSAGYSVTFDVCPDGKAPDGTICDAIVTAQKINHIALVDKGRAGPDCRIQDKRPRGEDRMAEVKMTFDGVPFAVADATAEAVVGKIIAARDAAVAALDAATAKHDAAVAKLDAEIADLKTKVVDEATIDKRAAEKADVLADAKALVDTDFSGKTIPEIKRAVVLAKVGDSMKDKSDDYIAARFDTLKDTETDGVQKIVNQGVENVGDAAAEFAKARAKRLAEMRGETVN